MDKDGNKIYSEDEINDLSTSIYALFELCIDLIFSLFCY